jgi:Dockerin type I domain
MKCDTTVRKAGFLLSGLLWLLLALAGTAVAQGDAEPLTVSDIRICNLRGNTFAVTWRTNQATSDNVIKLGLSPEELTQIREDQLAPPSLIHYVETGLLSSPTYYFVVSSDGVEGASSSVGYDSVITTGQLLASPGAIIQGHVIDSQSSEPLGNVIVRSFYRWTSGTKVDSTMWLADLTNDDGKFVMNMGNYRKYGGGLSPYYSGDTWLFLEILSQTTGEIASDSVLLTFPINDLGQFQTLTPYEAINESLVMPGDVDGNGTLNIFDVLDILKVIGGKVTPDPRMSVASDVDANGKIDIFDLLALLKKLRPAATASS